MTTRASKTSVEAASAETASETLVGSNGSTYFLLFLVLLARAGVFLTALRLVVVVAFFFTIASV